MMKNEESDKGKASLYSLGTGAAAALMPSNPYASAAALGLHMGDFLYRQMRLREKEKKSKVSDMSIFKRILAERITRKRHTAEKVNPPGGTNTVASNLGKTSFKHQRESLPHLMWVIQS